MHCLECETVGTNNAVLWVVTADYQESCVEAGNVVAGDPVAAVPDVNTTSYQYL